MKIILFEKEMVMSANQMHEDIKEINLSYLLLAQQMIRVDKVSAIFRLGVSEELAELIVGLSPAQMLKMAATNMLLLGAAAGMWRLGTRRFSSHGG